MKFVKMFAIVTLFSVISTQRVSAQTAPATDNNEHR